MSVMALSDDARTIDPIAFPGSGTAREKLAFLARYAVLAPSGHVTQPWRFVVADNHVDVVADLSRALRVVDPHYRDVTMSCASAAETLLEAVRAYGYQGVLTPLPEPHAPTVIARVAIGAEARRTMLDRDMLTAILRRRTEQRRYAQTQVPTALQTLMRETARPYGVGLHLVSDVATKDKIARLVVEADQIQFADPAFRAEFASLNSGTSGLSRMAAALFRVFDLGGNMDRSAAKDAPLLGVFTTKGDGHADWVASGRAFAAVLHGVTMHGLANAVLNQPIEVEATRRVLGSVLGSSETPQLLSRFGYLKESVTLPRTDQRPRKEVLIAV
ncbi:MAG: hypothetical protein MUO41_10845 [Methyloceanibacter sp.]|nr:hypothetical protein [Methyloceanibacter sp.]